MLFTVFFYIFVAITVIQFIYYLVFGFSIANRKKNTSITSFNSPVSVIVYIKNNAEDLQKNLPYIINQDYNEFEIVLVNHASTDNSSALIEELQEKHANIKVVNVENKEAFWGNKKYALTLGIKASSHDYLLFIDCKFQPFSNQWVKEITSNFNTPKEIIIGYKKLATKKYSFSNIFVRFINCLTFIKALSFSKIHKPFKGFQENIAFTKNTFFNVKGFINHINIPIGESDLFLKDAASIENTVFSIQTNSFVVQQENFSFKNFLAQYRNQHFLFSQYNNSLKIIISLFNITKIFFYPLAIVTSIWDWKLSLPFIIFYFLIQFIALLKPINILKERNLLYFLPILDIYYTVFIVLTTVTNTFSKPKPWS
ncbi:Glycosyltransferase, catalytic subunit of cellulose synthase and poly-beta-1,6-N-acetylglucosamine synthase [Tenacibaculum sp. 190524A02b]|uniref:Glycosyltransferase, catalytic subunit of cellulose synthase and poly-beta-1,6-N-acetylglucosamine synthase n=1 Tax=Tenacibaculum vairaonense TaxID=3137860 RepID=A0ABP1FDZ2_9FLAO